MFESSSLLASLQRQWTAFMAALPDVVLALGLLFVGWLAARLVRRLAIRFLRAIRVDVLAERAGIEDFLIQGDVRLTTVTLLAAGLYWMILLGIFVALLDSLGVRAAGDLFSRMVNYLPNVLLAVGILVFGSLLARILGGLVSTYLSNIGSGAAEPIGAIARLAVLAFVLFMAAEQLAIQSQVLVSAFQIAFAALCFALALAFGLGGRDWAASVIERYARRSQTR
jgi:MFS family permease